MKVKVQNIQIEMTLNEAEMLCSVLEKFNWSNFHPDSQVTEGYMDLVNVFINMVSKEVTV